MISRKASPSSEPTRPSVTFRSTRVPSRLLRLVPAPPLRLFHRPRLAGICKRLTRRKSSPEAFERAEPRSPTVYDWIVISALDR
ncbi:hypothetical protein F0562_024221 [Nyssa sinensis]|uniref:Uncharacterized protein n=1 Tax=Nyssa sinensis TaxID=561372 RepID=A0A5J5BCK0_9ASTE|nr:hypothetical protein F0562_024221 [Nyssa sinensis]